MVHEMADMLDSLGQLIDALVNIGSADFAVKKGGVIESLPELPIPPVRGSLSPADKEGDSHTS